MSNNHKWLISALNDATEFMQKHLQNRKPEVGLILGSGLGPLAEHIEDPIHIPFADVTGMKTSTATSHVGRFVSGRLGSKEVIAMQGRIHGYGSATCAR